MAFGYTGVHQVVLPILDHHAELPAPQRAALDAALGRVQHDAPDPFLVGLAVPTSTMSAPGPLVTSFGVRSRPPARCATRRRAAARPTAPNGALSPRDDRADCPQVPNGLGTGTQVP